jgi:hypothetical protein
MPARHARTHSRPKPKAAPTKNRPKGAQPINTNARTHGFYSRRFDDDELALIVQFCTDPTLDDEIAMQRVANLRLAEKLSQVTDQELYVRMFEALSIGMGRMISLLRAKRALAGDAADGLLGAIGQALDELKTEFGVDL